MTDKGKVLIDGDIIAYRAAFSTEDQLEQDTKEKVENLVNSILDETIDLPFPEPSEYQVFLTGRTNFRFDVAISHPYKGNRAAKDKPKYLRAAREHMIDKYDAIVSVDEEADDLLAKGAAALNYWCVVASVDKDMLQLPCWHFNFGKNTWSKVGELDGLHFFYTQILTGDAADNIKGLKGIGPKKAEVLMKDVTDEASMWAVVVKAYDGDVTRIIENARLLWLRRYDDQMWEPPEVT